MTPMKERVSDEKLSRAHDALTSSGTIADMAICTLVDDLIDSRAYARAKCAEVDELRGLINEVLPVGDIADGLAPYYIESDTIHRMRKALEGKE